MSDIRQGKKTNSKKNLMLFFPGTDKSLPW